MGGLCLLGFEAWPFDLVSFTTAAAAFCIPLFISHDSILFLYLWSFSSMMLMYTLWRFLLQVDLCMWAEGRFVLFKY